MTHTTYISTPPPIESLLEEDANSGYWPYELIGRPNFQYQLQRQRTLMHLLRQAYSLLPMGMTLAEGLDTSFITETQTEKICHALATQLKHDAAQQRLALYMPIELLSPIATGSTATKQLHHAYRVAWEQQLYQHEVRANYVDGDVLEPELRTKDQPRVVKAAHLIPGLLQVGHLTVAEVLTYQSRATDSILKRSIRDACMVAADLGLFPREWIFCCADDTPHEITKSTALTDGRARWLASVEIAKQRTTLAVRLVVDLWQGRHVSDFVTRSHDLVVALEAVRLAALQNTAVLQRHKDWVTQLASQTNEADVCDGLVTLCAHLYAKGLMNRNDLNAWGVTIPDLGGPFFANQHRLEPSGDAILETCKRISLHPRLAQLVYPVVLIFGSQIKGYGLTEADCDVAVFIRPGVDRGEQAYLTQELASIYDDEHFGGKVILFWLEEVGEQLRVIDWPELTYTDGGSSWLHVLFGALWFGEKITIKLLYERLLTPYFTAPSALLAGKPVYERWIEEMERDSLQYRLLHKGFERYYPIQSPVNTPHGDLIDGQAAFYDPQYRRIATELYVRRVWLPQM